MCTKSVSPNATYQSNNIENTNETKEEIKGSGGFFFWETRKGYNFFAIDSLLADEKSTFNSDKLDRKAWGSEPDEPYTERPANVGDGGDDRFTIKRKLFTTEVNLMETLRKGKLATKVAFFNHSTGGYSEYNYRLSDNYNNMAHLGGQTDRTTKLPIGLDSRDLGDFPSRTLSVYIDHETWYNEPELLLQKKKMVLQIRLPMLIGRNIILYSHFLVINYYKIKHVLLLFRKCRNVCWRSN